MHKKQTPKTLSGSEQGQRLAYWTRQITFLMQVVFWSLSIAGSTDIRAKCPGSTQSCADIGVSSERFCRYHFDPVNSCKVSDGLRWRNSDQRFGNGCFLLRRSWNYCAVSVWRSVTKNYSSATARSPLNVGDLLLSQIRVRVALCCTSQIMHLSRIAWNRFLFFVSTLQACCW